jgi:hypothetical protein
MTEPKQRGRPRLMPQEVLEQLRRLEPNVHTERQHQNRYLAHQAMGILGLIPESTDQLPPPTWLVDWQGANRGKQGAIKWAILEQLGRMSHAGLDDGSIRSFAAAIEEQRMNVKDAAARLRRVRLTARSGPSPMHTGRNARSGSSPKPPH